MGSNLLNTFWIYFALAAPALYGVTNFFDKFLIEKRIRDPLLITIFGGLVSLFLGAIILAFKSFQFIEVRQCILLLVSGILLILYLIPYFKALLVEDTSQVVPLLQFIPVFVLILSHVFLGETLTIKQILGSALIIGSGFFLGTDKIHKGIFTPRKTFWYMMLASLLYAITSVLFKLVVNAQDFWLTYAYENIGIGVGAFILLLWSPYRIAFKREIKKLKMDVWGLLSINQGFLGLAQFSSFYALLLAPVALVSVVLSTQPFFVLLYGLFLSIWFPMVVKENVEKMTILIKLISMILIFIGIYLIYL